MANLRCLHLSQCPCGQTLFGPQGCVSCNATREQPRAPVKLKRDLRKPNRYGNPGRPRSEDLTAREREMAVLLAKGLMQKDIATTLGVCTRGRGFDIAPRV